MKVNPTETSCGVDRYMGSQRVWEDKDFKPLYNKDAI